MLGLQLSRTGNRHTLRLQIQTQGAGCIEAVLRETRGAALEVHLASNEAPSALLHRLAESLESRVRQIGVELEEVVVSREAWQPADDRPSGRQRSRHLSELNPAPLRDERPRRVAACPAALKGPSTATEYLG